MFRETGTLSWARRTNGRLGAIDRLRLLGQAALSRLWRRHRTTLAIDIDTLRVPDSALCARAVEAVTAVSEPWLVNHCLRTYLWGAIIGTGERRRFDEELLFVAALFHDLGLAKRGSADCFAVDGAFMAEELLRDEPRGTKIAEAISLHLNVTVPPRLGVEAHLLHEGAALDVIGARFRQIEERTREQVLARHPRQAIKENLVSVVKEQSAIRPQSRAAFLCAHGFIGLIRRAPFAS